MNINSATGYPYGVGNYYGAHPQGRHAAGVQVRPKYDHDARYKFTQEEINTINLTGEYRSDNGLLDEPLNHEKLIKTVKSYDKLKTLPVSEQADFVYLHSMENEYNYSAILKSKEAKRIPKGATLLRFDYIQDLKDSVNDCSFLNKIKSKIYESRLKHIKDPLITREIYQRSSSRAQDIIDNFKLLDAINCAEGKYSSLRREKDGEYSSNYGNFDIFLQKSTGMKVGQIIKYGQVPPRLQQRLRIEGITDRDFIKDLEIDVKYHNLRECMLDVNCKHISDHLYEKYYLQNIPKDMYVSPETISKCKELNQKHGVKIFLGSYMKDSERVLDYIDRELTAWESASGYQAIMPKIINFNLARKDWFSNISSETQRPAGAYATYNGEICFPNINLQKVAYALRHEMTHINDKTKHCYVNRDPLFAQVKSGKYRHEYEEGRISPDLIDYAHTDPGEYIAVASEGKMSEYSPQFRHVLKELGMPEWEFDLEDIN